MSVNKILLVGRVGRDAEVRYTPSGTAVCNVSIATGRSWKDKASGERRDETEWHRVVIYDRLAEVAGEMMTKGRLVYIEGRNKTRKWEDKQGGEHYTTEVIASEFQMLDAKPVPDDGDGDSHRPSDEEKIPF